MKKKVPSIAPDNPEKLEEELLYLKLPFLCAHYKTMADEAAAKQHSHIEYLQRLVQGEAEGR